MHSLTGNRATRRLALVLIVALTFAVTACGSASPTPTPVPSGPLELAGTRWVLIKYLSPDGVAVTVPASVTPTAEFTADTMSGRSGCNTFSAGYTLDGDSFTLTAISSTMMACEEPIASVETAYLAALAVLDKAALLADGNLQLWDSGGKTTLIYVKGS